MELDIRGTEAWLIKEYLTRLGGVETAPDAFEGEGWTVALTLGEHRFGRWVFPRVIITFSGDPARVAAVAGRLRLMTFRGGG
ncbi:MAG TPA: hypothetical protein VD969_18420 [Symbiobacteriaceae bacterium]|nr:hypothetical protein [Symbiobacteriaceae bacterium]